MLHNNPNLSPWKAANSSVQQVRGLWSLQQGVIHYYQLLLSPAAPLWSRVQMHCMKAQSASPQLEGGEPIQQLQMFRCSRSLLPGTGRHLLPAFTCLPPPPSSFLLPFFSRQVPYLSSWREQCGTSYTNFTMHMSPQIFCTPVAMLPSLTDY